MNVSRGSTPVPDGEAATGAADGKTALRAGEAHALAILDAALDAVVTIDHLGRVLEFNRAAETTFGYRRQDVLGQELAELIVPPESREAHRKALTRWTADGPMEGAGTLLGRRVDVEAMRADGTVFPAELAISRVEIPGPPVFTACIRDASERHDTEARLKAAELRYRTLVEQLPLISYVDQSDDPISKPLYISPQSRPCWAAPPTNGSPCPSSVRELDPPRRPRLGACGEAGRIRARRAAAVSSTE